MRRRILGDVQELFVTCTYNVTDTNSTTKICDKTDWVKKIVVDGTTESGIPTGKTFTTVGEHEVTFVLARNTTSVGSGAFSGCTNLNTVIFSESITSIKSYAFSKCSNLRILLVRGIVN
jgi:hypothetical protein